MIKLIFQILTLGFLVANIVFSVFALNSLLELIGSYKMFRKAGEKGWKSIIPFLNDYTRFKLYWNPKMYWIFLAAMVLSGLYVADNNLVNFISIAASITVIVFIFRMRLGMARSHGKNVGMAILLTILPGLGSMILGFDKSEYTKPEEKEPKIKVDIEFKADEKDEAEAEVAAEAEVVDAEIVDAEPAADSEA